MLQFSLKLSRPSATIGDFGTRQYCTQASIDDGRTMRREAPVLAVDGSGQ